MAPWPGSITLCPVKHLPTRRTPAAATAKGRLPIGTPGQGGVNTSHSHIQIVPREDDDFVDETSFGEDVPTFRSPSLQFLPSSDVTSRRRFRDTPNDTSKGKTFADMARRFNNRDLAEGEEHPTSGPVSLVGLIKLQPHRKRGNKTWRPLQLSDFGEDDNHNDDVESDHDEPVAQTHSVSLASRPSHFDLPPLQTEFNISPVSRRQALPSNPQSISDAPSASAMFMRATSEDISPTNTRGGIVDDVTRMFGKLPDPIRLQECVGTEDGEIIFIGHPNRDVSAHQWSTKSFQWVNIGQYSHNRRRVEGSLASDRLRGQAASESLPLNSLEYFKAIAEQRQRMVKESRSEQVEERPSPSLVHHLEESQRPNLTDAEHFASLSSASGSTGERFPTLARLGSSRAAAPGLSQAPTSALRPVTKDYLEDPFVTPAKPLRPALPEALNAQNRTSNDTLRGGIGATGSMDFEFEFPTKSAACENDSSQLAADPGARRQLFIQREQERIRRDLWPQERQAEAHLREIDVGEDAMSRVDALARRPTFTRSGVQAPLSPEDAQNRQRLKNRLAELGDQARRLELPVDGRVAIPDVSDLSMPVRALFPPGLTVANPSRAFSALNANATPYSHLPTNTQASADTDSEVTTVNAAAAANLRFSDPDGIRQLHVPEIATGLGHHGPTPQNFKGPFFVDTMPTTHDPTISLASQVPEIEKLQNWFQDGQNPVREEEYYKSFMSTANDNAKTRGMRSFGAVGDASPSANDLSRFENTRAFLKLCESLQEYYLESTNQQTGGAPKFETGFKPAPSHLCDLGPGGNNSFFEPVSPRPSRSESYKFQPYGGPSWGGFGLNMAAAVPNRTAHQ
ncbi:hypothetical protein K469DRAFT_800483 [Zopfia rhizophila CBS 207.26]|uniref:Uncharacterized protein n=1 Tax=Zopfia rhizophila CBS 207.26 TaxID=1314779 RepID=A0A6A6ERF8_9PEZI|nr:hypothetical protein K469DRAFT_800483 [Zopfia rhizophila CBS 207.26]